MNLSIKDLYNAAVKLGLEDKPLFIDAGEDIYNLTETNRLDPWGEGIVLTSGCSVNEHSLKSLLNV